MTAKVTIDFFTVDPNAAEFVMYLVEGGPWNEAGLEERLKAIQARVYGAVDVAIDGHLARAHPESRGMPARIQVDLRDNPPAAVERLVARLAEHITTDEEYRRDIGTSPYIGGLRILARRA